MKLTDKNLSKRIIDDLSNHCKAIPSKGFMAGGAVANTVFNIFWGDKEYPINDIDIFFETNRASTPNYEWDTVHTPMRSDSLSVEGDGYNVTKCVYDSSVRYKVLTTKRDGLLNMIEISSIGDRTRNYDYILKGFDLNCCQIGINLETGELIYTKEFEELLTTKQLDITSFYTPAHTVMRIFKKIDELGLYCNVEQCMEILSQPLLSNNITFIKSLGFSIYFSTKYMELYKKYYREISKYFTMVKFFDHKKQIWDMINGNDDDFNENHAINWLDPNRTIPKYMLDKWANYKNIWTLVPKKETKNKIVEECLNTFRLYNPISLRVVYDLTKKNKITINKINLILKGYDNFICKLLLITVEDFVDCDFSEKHIEVLETFINRENWIINFIVKQKLNLQKTYNLISNIKKIYNKEGNWVSRLLDRVFQNGNLDKDKLLHNYKYLYDNVLIEKKYLEDDFIEPIDISFVNLPSDISINELTSEYMLKWAGHKLKNCINDAQQNYKHKIESGYCRLFLIETKNNLSAMEIRLEGIEYKISQLLSYCNKETSILHKTIGELFTQKLSLHNLQKNIESRINNLKKSITLHNNLLLSLPDDNTKENQTRFGGGYVNPPEPIRGRDNHQIDLDEILNIIEDPLDIDDIINRR